MSHFYFCIVHFKEKIILIFAAGIWKFIDFKVIFEFKPDLNLPDSSQKKS